MRDAHVARALPPPASASPTPVSPLFDVQPRPLATHTGGAPGSPAAA